MKYVNTIFCALLLLFIGVQYNDPDGPLWMLIYAIPALWTAIAVFNPLLLYRITARVLLALCLLAMVAGVFYYWPTVPHWWRKDIWWVEETAREGMGVMIALAALLVVLLTGWLGRLKISAASNKRPRSDSLNAL